MFKILESTRLKTYFFNYYIKRQLLLKESILKEHVTADFMMQVSMEEFAIVAYLYNFLFKRRPLKFLKKEKYGQKQEKLPLKVRFDGKDFFYFIFFFRYWLIILANKNKQLYNYSVNEHKITCNFIELSILLKNIIFDRALDLYGLLSDLRVDIYINNNGNRCFSSYYSFFRYNFI